MGLTYPAGPEIDRLAEQGNPAAFDFPAPAAARRQRRFQFQRPENFRALFYPRPSGNCWTIAQKVRDLCASVQAAIVEVLVKKTIRAARRNGVRCVTASGGVTCNRALRNELTRRLRTRRLHIASRRKNTLHRQRRDDRDSGRKKITGQRAAASLDEEIKPGWVLA